MFGSTVVVVAGMVVSGAGAKVVVVAGGTVSTTGAGVVAGASASEEQALMSRIEVRITSRRISTPCHTSSGSGLNF